MKYLFILTLLFSFSNQSFSQKEYPELEQQALDCINQVRAHPAEFAEKYIKKNENKDAKECYNELTSTKPLKVLEMSDPLYKSALLHAKDCYKHNLTGHVGHKGSTVKERIEKYGSWNNFIGENCHYGKDNAIEIIVDLLIDSGIPNRGHRKNLLSKDYRFVGICVYSHPGYKIQTVMDFAADIVPRK
jgi:uncharacterized protein YkwD